MPVGLSPNSAYEVNSTVGQLLRTFTDLKESIGHNHEWLVTADLKIDPYNMSAEEETLIKSAIGDLDTTLDGIDMTFINRLTGLF
jgi:hypothetical protein